jgi:predicted MPP superfamily phosphohydrolase
LARGTSLRILQLSDVHLGLIERGRRLDKILGFINQLHPDLILSTGDLVDGCGDHLNHLYERLAAVRPPLGKFAVTGNHEFYVGIDKSVEFHRLAGFRLLRGEAVDVAGGRLRLAGVDDPTEMRFSLNALGKGRTSEPALLGDHHNGAFTILLKHQPAVLPASVGKFDLMLSGHTHRGQIFPFSLVVRIFFARLAGTYDLGQGSLLHVSRGTGTWGPPMRLFAPPEVTLITITGE